MGRYKADQRYAAFEECAHALSWSYKQGDEFDMVKWLLDFKLFKVGMRKRITPLIIKENDDLEFSCMFDYAYTVSNGKITYILRTALMICFTRDVCHAHN